MDYTKIKRETELINRVRDDWFAAFDANRAVGNIDFAVAVKDPDDGKNRLLDVETDYLLWAEAKAATVPDILAPLAQLVHTIGKERPFTRHLPPKYLAAFDAEKIAFVEYHRVLDIFAMTDFNWNTAPNDHTTREHALIRRRLVRLTGAELFQFFWDENGKDLKTFITQNFKSARGGTAKIQITRNNFTAVYAKWRRAVMPSIAIDWNAAKKRGILDGDFFLADVLSDNNKTLADKLLFVLLKGDCYEFDHQRSDLGDTLFRTVGFNDEGRAHAKFWAVYERPPKRMYWDYIVERRDLLVPQDVREVKGAFFTPARWVELSQQYLADTLGENWQSEYTVWDCCAGTGNLLAGLTNPANIYASTLDKADVTVMHDRIRSMNAAGRNGKGANLLPGNVFQFDFLNDDLLGPKVPETLKAILRDSKKRKKLVIYINPPYAEAATARTVTDTSDNKPGVATNNTTHEKYNVLVGRAANELFALFLIRIYKELQCCKLAQFAKLKALCASNFAKFREVFRAKLLKLFAVPAETFDNVDGDFPIGFHIWDTGLEEKFECFTADIYDKNGRALPPKMIHPHDNTQLINAWYSKHYDTSKDPDAVIGIMNTRGNDFQNQKYIRITSDDNHNHTNVITARNLIASCVYLAVRQAIPATWLNDRDQFLCPADSWAEDCDFQNDCLIFTLFHGQNRISGSSCAPRTLSVTSARGARELPVGNINHWIPFTETEVGARASFASHFMSDFLRGRVKQGRSNGVTQGELFNSPVPAAGTTGDILSALTPAARAVYDAGRALWRYYHAQAAALPDASYYDIRGYFKGFDDRGKMRAKSGDETFNTLDDALRGALDALAARLEPKIRLHGFLR